MSEGLGAIREWLLGHLGALVPSIPSRAKRRRRGEKGFYFTYPPPFVFIFPVDHGQ
ncbi:MAG TPA: hypothetical protein VIG57_13475 [Candidatus Entotheonella sp.]